MMTQSRNIGYAPAVIVVKSIKNIGYRRRKSFIIYSYTNSQT